MSKFNSLYYFIKRNRLVGLGQLSLLIFKSTNERAHAQNRIQWRSFNTLSPQYHCRSIR